ncbi:MAG: hypothetical protein AAF721_41485 [Myxococcota bacterium]
MDVVSGAAGRSGCVADRECDDGDACTADVCSAGHTCTHAPLRSVACRPSIEVSAPMRGATLQGPKGATVAVEGVARTGTGAVRSLTLNGADVPLGPNGEFAVEVDAQLGGNRLVLEATDAHGFSRRRVQSFVWSTEYVLPRSADDGAADPAFVVSLSGGLVDDGRRPRVPNDLAGIAAATITALPFTPYIDATTPVASSAGYDVLVGSVDKASAQVNLRLIDDGLHVEASVLDVSGDLTFDCTTSSCALAGGDDVGRFGIESIDLTADVELAVAAGGRLDVEVTNLSTDIGALSLSSRGAWTDFLLGVAGPQISKTADEALRTELSGEVSRGLAAGAPEVAAEVLVGLPSLGEDPAQVIGTRAFVTLSSLTVQGAPRSRAEATFRAAALSARPAPPLPADHLGIPARAGCDGSPDAPAIPGRAPAEAAITDAALNQVLHAGWRAGWLKFAIAELGVEIEGLAAPTASDCHPGRALSVHIGDLAVTGADYQAYVSLRLGLSVNVDVAGFSLSVTGVDSVTTELSALRDVGLAQEAAWVSALEAALSDRLSTRLGHFAALAWPALEIAGHPEISTALPTVVPTLSSPARRAGLTMVTGDL